MSRRRETRPLRPGRSLPVLIALLMASAVHVPECAAAQRSAEPRLDVAGREGVIGTPVMPPSARDRRVVISLEEHRLYVMQGDRVAWSAPIGTGTGERLESQGRSWDFSTPPGEYMIQYKEKDPVWVLPDWVFVKRGEPIPPEDSPERWVTGELGAAALYLTREIAIHGTDQPDLLGAPVSHGCIRMSNEDVLRLYGELEVGTPVVVH